MKKSGATSLTRLKNLEKRVKQLEELVVSLLSIDEVPETETLESDLIEEAVEVISHYDFVSTSLLQRRLVLDYDKAVLLLERLEEEGYLAPAGKSSLRRVLRAAKSRWEN